MEIDYNQAIKDVHYLISEANTIWSLLGYKNDSMRELNRERYLVCLDQIIETAKKLKQLKRR